MPDARDWRQEIAKALGEEVASRTDVIEEMAQHVDARYRSLLARGVAEPEAYRGALEELSDPNRLAEEIRRIGPAKAIRLPEPDAYGRRAGWLDVLRHDVRYGLRTLRHSPGFTFLALALGIGR